MPDLVAPAVAKAASVLLLAGAALATQVPPRFTLGDSREQVRAIQGRPQVIERLASQGVEHWSWAGDEGTVTFDFTTGAVIGWNDPRHLLRVALRAAPGRRDSLVSLGSGLDDVARLLGTPWAVTPDRRRRQAYLAYGWSVVRIDLATQRVNGWARRDMALRVNPADDSLAHAALSVARLSPLPGGGSIVTTAPPGGGRVPSPTPPAYAAAPRLSLAAVHIADASGDGRLAPREFADITLRLRNDGPTPLAPLAAHVVRTPGLVLIAGAPDTLWLGAMAPGDTTDVVVTAYATGTVATPELALVTLAPGATARFATRIPTTTSPATLPATMAARPSDARPDDPARDIPSAAARNPDALAVILGVGRYDRLAEARFAALDAELVRAYAVQALGIPDDGAHLVVRTDRDASGSELRRLLGDRGWLARRATDNSDLFVYFAGHGAAAGPQRVPHLLPSDADASYVEETGLDLTALLDRLARLPARSITVLIDACFTGATRSGRPLVPGTRAAVVSIEHPALLRRNMAVFLASRDAQVAGDLPAVGHGAFTWTLARGLRGDADANKDRTVTVAELGRWLEVEVARASAALDREQQPLTIARDTLRPVARLAPVPRP